MKKNNKPLVLILCGGQSLRLWPLSEHKSKNFVDVFGFSPLEVTIKRFLRIAPAENIFLVANAKEKRQLEKVKRIKKSNIFYEPESKNTAAAILLSLLHLKKYLDRPIIITPVDNLLKNEKAFQGVIKKALAEAKKNNICTIGIIPSEPTPHFGYILAAGSPSKGAMAVKKFIEKPKLEMATQLIKKGNCFYNSGMFIATVEALLGEYKKYYPDYEKFLKYFKSGKILALYKKIDNTPFDKAIMEKTKKVKVIKGSFFWKDFGSWHAIYALLPKDKSGHVKKGKIFTHKGKNNLIYLDDPKKKVLVLGLEDVFFIDTKGFTLLTTRSHINELKSALKEFKRFI
jgi:mannose-1-phosphate guanylyltransferase